VGIGADLNWQAERIEVPFRLETPGCARNIALDIGADELVCIHIGTVSDDLARAMRCLTGRPESASSLVLYKVYKNICFI